MTQAEKEERILRVLADGAMPSRALADFAELTTAQFYPAIMLMERAGKVVSEFADMDYPRQRMYRLPASASRCRAPPIRHRNPFIT
jgi:hypothetical protein